MPAGIPVATMAIGEAGATNAAILAAEILALSDSALAERLHRYRKELAKKTVSGNPVPPQREE
jgi:5-(carboxyamino)imidazole ribonucleotide mutase